MVVARLGMLALIVSSLGIGSAAVAGPPPPPRASALAAAALHDRELPSDVPADFTPAVDDGAVHAIARVGTQMVIGGNFTSVEGAPRSRLAAFDRQTGALSPLSLDLDGEVDVVLPGPTPHTAYIAGRFRHLNGGRVYSLALIDTLTGELVPTFTAPRLTTGFIRDVKRFEGRLYVVGTFAEVSGEAHSGIVALNSRTGAVSRAMSVQLTGHHNESVPGVQGRGPWSLDLTSGGSRMVVVGNFMRADDRVRDQVVMLHFSSGRWVVSKGWATRRFTPICNPQSYDSYARAVAFTPDSSSFAIITAGGGVTNTLCDTVSRWSTTARGQHVQPIWVTRSGGDSHSAVLVTDDAVIVGGHQRWENNPHGADSAGPGAVPRPGIVALDLMTGLPLRWNPGRNPRGVGVFALTLTNQGLWMGSDTDFVGNRQYRRPRIALFPWEGGSKIASTRTGALPGHVLLVRPAGSASPMVDVTFTGTSATSEPVGSAYVAPDDARGAFKVGKWVHYGMADGTLHRLTYQGSTFGTSETVDPYHDPVWAGVYNGVSPTFYTAELGSVSGMFYDSGRLYFTKAGSPELLWRSFVPDSGVVSEILHHSTTPAALSFAKVRGMFKVGSRLYYVRSGNLYRVAMQGTRVSGESTQVSGPSIDGVSWKNRALFLTSS